VRSIQRTIARQWMSRFLVSRGEGYCMGHTARPPWVVRRGVCKLKTKPQAARKSLISNRRDGAREEDYRESGALCKRSCSDRRHAAGDGDRSECFASVECPSSDQCNTIRNTHMPVGVGLVETLVLGSRMSDEKHQQSNLRHARRRWAHGASRAI